MQAFCSIRGDLGGVGIPAYAAGRRGMNKIDLGGLLRVSMAPKKSSSHTPKKYWKYPSCLTLGFQVAAAGVVLLPAMVRTPT